MSNSLSEKLADAIWIAKSLYDRGKTSGSSANLSFLHNGEVYITASGTCFGKLNKDDFVREGGDGKPSKELLLHKTLYNKCSGTQAVIHVHSTYATLWSCLKHNDTADVVPAYTPYLGMKLGKVGLVPYAPPGSKELFSLFEEYALSNQRGYLLQNHGPIIGAKSLFDAYYALEELEESSRLAWLLRNEPKKESMLIT